MKKRKSSQLILESKVYKILQGRKGIPLIYGIGCEGDFNFLIIELLGPSIEDLFNLCKRHFSIITVSLLALQMVLIKRFL